MKATSVLIVEDEHVVALDLRNSLESLGYEVVGCAASGEEAMRLVDSNPPDVVLMDIHLQGPIDGIESCSRIRARHNLPVIYLTAYSDPDTLERAKITRPFGYILKPFEFHELRSTIEMALHKYGLEKKLRPTHSRDRLQHRGCRQGSPLQESRSGGQKAVVGPLPQDPIAEQSQTHLSHRRHSAGRPTKLP